MSKTPKTDAAREWLACAKKHESIVYWRGRLDRACNTPEANMSNAERRDHSAKVKAAKRAGVRAPRIPDPYKHEREDARQIIELVEQAELRGLVELRTVVFGRHDHVYEMTCIVQRNGLAAVRNRK